MVYGRQRSHPPRPTGTPPRRGFSEIDRDVDRMITFRRSIIDSERLRQRTMGQARDYEALIRQLLVGVASGWSYERVMGWLSLNHLQDRELAQWLQEHGVVLCQETKVRSRLV
jgi:hypothetical protein